MTLSDLAYTLCDVKRDHIVSRTKGYLNSVYFYSHGEDTTSILIIDGKDLIVYDFQFALFQESYVLSL